LHLNNPGFCKIVFPARFFWPASCPAAFDAFELLDALTIEQIVFGSDPCCSLGCDAFSWS
jgi:hypothetical protein